MQDITQAGQAEGVLIDSSTNVTAKSIISGMITLAVKGSASIFGRASASSFYIEVEQLSVMHFLDSVRFDTMIGLIRANNAYAVAKNPATGRPYIEFTTSAQQTCGSTTGLSCVVYNNIYDKLVKRESAVHPLATGISTTSADGTRNWLMNNILKATDSFSQEIATNMTGLVRSNFGINDRVNKAWFINPGNRWNVPLTAGAQSNLLLTDKLVLFAIITLNDGSGNILRRRLLSFSPSSIASGSSRSASEVQISLPPATGSLFIHDDREDQEDAIEESMMPRLPSISSRVKNAGGRMNSNGRALLQTKTTSTSVTVPKIDATSIQSDDAIFVNALKRITQEPRLGTLPPIDYSVDIPLTAATIFGVEKRAYSMINMELYGVFDGQMSTDAVGEEFFRRLSVNLPKFCPMCEKIYPVFNNVGRMPPSSSQSSSGTRRLLQTNTNSNSGQYSILLVYDPKLLDTAIYYSDISRAVYSSTYTPVWSGASDEASIKSFMDSLESNQFAVKSVKLDGGSLQ